MIDSKTRNDADDMVTKVTTPRRSAQMCCSSQTAVVTPIRQNRSLDAKIHSIRTNLSGAKDFILADAKDADMAAGLAAPGKDITGKIRSLNEYRDQMREVTRQGLVDIM